MAKILKTRAENPSVEKFNILSGNNLMHDLVN